MQHLWKTSVLLVYIYGINNTLEDNNSYMKMKDLVKTVDTKNIKHKSDCFQRGDQWYEQEPKWDRKEFTEQWSVELASMMVRQGRDPNWTFYKELEVTEYGKPIDYVEQSIFDSLADTNVGLKDELERYEELGLRYVVPGLLIIGSIIGFTVGVWFGFLI